MKERGDGGDTTGPAIGAAGRTVMRRGLRGATTRPAHPRPDNGFGRPLRPGPDRALDRAADCAAARGAPTPRADDVASGPAER